MAFCTTNTLFVRNLSPHVSEGILRETFGKCDAVERVLFRSFPGRATEYFAQIDFRTSAGVTEGFKLSGTPILGVTCQVSVMDPGCKAKMKQVWERRDQQLQPPDDVPHPDEPQGVQAEYMRRFKEAMEDKRLRTVHVAGLPDDVTDEGLRHLCGQFGEVLEIRIDADHDGKYFALVEFKDLGVAHAIKTKQQFLVDGRVFLFTEAKTLVDMKSFAEQSVHFSTPIFDAATMKAVLTYQCHLNPKLAKARAAAAEIMNEPVPPETEAILKEAEKGKEEPEPVQWPGRSEKDPTQWPWRPSDSAKERSQRRSRSRERRTASGRRSRRGERGRRRQRLPGDSRSRSGRRRRGERGRRRRAQEEEGEQAINLDDEDIAMVPNTEMLVLGETSSYSDGSCSPARREGGGSAEEKKVEAGPPPEPPPECHEVASQPSPARSIPDSPTGEERIPLLVEEERPQGDDAPPALGCDTALPSVEASDTALEPEATVDAIEPRPSDTTAETDAQAQATGTDEPVSGAASAASKWECSCGEVNKASRTQCNNCGKDAPWLVREEPVEAVDELSTPSPASPSPPRSLAASPESPPRSVAESPPSPARSVAASGSARSVAESPERKPASISGSEGGPVDLAESNSDQGEEEKEIQWEADRVCGEVADARARIFHDMDA